MKKNIFIFYLLLLVFLSCFLDGKQVQYIGKSKVVFKDFIYNKDSLVLLDYPLKSTLNNIKDTIIWRGIDSYTCWARDSVLEICFAYGIMTNGQDLQLIIFRDSVTANLQNWSDGSLGEDFRYDIINLELTLTNQNYLTSDSIVGKIKIKGIQNIDDVKEDLIKIYEIKDWKKFEKSYIKPEVTLEGQFKLQKVEYYTDGGDELNRVKIYNDKIAKLGESSSNNR
jgi:hypothetical protein